MLNIKLKGVGAATLDRAVSLVIAGAILSGVVGGIAWLYKINEKDKFINDLHIISSGVISYYSHAGFRNLNYNSVKDAGFIPKAVDVSKVGSKKIRNRVRQSKDIYNLVLEDMNYDLCIASGKIQIQDLAKVSARGSNVKVENMPYSNPSKLRQFESFCKRVDRVKTMTYSFKRP